MNRSVGSLPDGQPDERQIFFIPTPGAANNPLAPPVKINEWLAGNTRTLADPADGDFDDWVELYNAGTTPVDLSDYYLTDDLGNWNKWKFPTGAVIPPDGFLLVWADEEQEQNGVQGTWHANFKLSSSGESIGLFTPGGVVVDSVTFGQQTNDVSQGRYPDGNAGSFYFMTQPTPGQRNRVPNQPPVLSSIGARSVAAGQTLRFQAVASDPDVPAQVLTFSLAPGAPAGASIEAATGRFEWAVPAEQASGVYPVTVRVTDSGTPAMQASETVSITVFRAPQVTSVTRNGGQIQMSWSTENGRRYQVQYTESLSQPNWQNLGPVREGTGASLTLEEPIAATQRYYRILIVP
jgi:hypothetical protein